jgi:hypothetical protein
MYYSHFTYRACLNLNVKFKVCKSMYHRTIQINRPARPRTQHDYHHDTKEKPEGATAVIELLMMGGKMPETC